MIDIYCKLLSLLKGCQVFLSFFLFFFFFLKISFRTNLHLLTNAQTKDKTGREATCKMNFCDYWPKHWLHPRGATHEWITQTTSPWFMAGWICGPTHRDKWLPAQQHDTWHHLRHHVPLLLGGCQTPLLCHHLNSLFGCYTCWLICFFLTWDFFFHCCSQRRLRQGLHHHILIVKV